MGALKTILGTAVGATLFAQSAAASQPLEQLFATCAGRLSAELEHQWLMRDPEAEATEHLLDAMIALLDATGSDADRARLMAIRIEAKYAHGTLLRRATFNDRPMDASWAAGHAQSQLKVCSALLLM